MENWFDGGFISQEDGIETTNHYKKNGFTSYQELCAFRFIDSIVNYKFIMGQNNEKSEELRKRRRISITKSQKLELYSELGLMELLNKALTMDEYELLKAQEEFALVNYEELLKKLSQEDKIIEDKLNNLKKI